MTKWSNPTNIKEDTQDRNSAAWQELCRYIDWLAAEEKDEFAPFEYLGAELFAQIFTLPESIAKLTKVRKMWLYGSRLRRIPPEIGKMTALEYFDPYTSYDLHWLPFEIVRCAKLKDSRVSTRALYGNPTNRKAFPDLRQNPVRYYGPNLLCSACGRCIDYEQTKQLWLSLQVATDILPLLANVCSFECEIVLRNLPEPPPLYPVGSHQGGVDLELPQMTGKQYAGIRSERRRTKEQGKIKHDDSSGLQDSKPLTLIRKIWDRK